MFLNTWDLLLPQELCKRTGPRWWSSAGPAIALFISKQPTAHCQQQLPSDHHFICPKPLEVSKACYIVQTQQWGIRTGPSSLRRGLFQAGSCALLTQDTSSSALGNEAWSSTAAKEGLVQATNIQFNTSPKYPKCVLWTSPTNDVKSPCQRPATLDPCEGESSPTMTYARGNLRKNLCPSPVQICFLLPAEKPKSLSDGLVWTVRTAVQLESSAMSSSGS